MRIIDFIFNFQFEEKATAEFILNPNCITPQLGNILCTEAKTLSVQIVLAEGTKLVISGTCSQIYKFRQYMTALLTQNMLSLPSQPQVHVNNSEAGNTVATADQVPQGKSFTGLSPDVLLLMPHLAEGRFKGMVFYPEEGRVEVVSSSEEEQEECISKFQSTYQSIIKNRQLKSGNLEVPPSFPTENLLKLLDEFNNKFSQCNFSFNEQTQSIRIVSISSRQFDQAKKLISDKLKENSFGANKSKPVKPPTKTGSFQVMSLGNDRVLTVKRSDIVSENVDVIVNAANEQLEHMAGVAGALNKASKGELQKHSRAYISRKGHVPVGGVAITQAGGNLKCKQVIHAVGPIATPFASDQKCSELLHQAVTNTLIEAQKLKASSISIPAISTGVFAVKKELAAEAILNAILTFNFTSEKLKDIRIVIIDEPTYACFAQHLVTKREFAEASDIPQSSDNDFSNNGFKVGDLSSTPVTFPPPGFNPAAAHIVTSQPTGGLTSSQSTTSTNIHYPDLSTALTQTNTVLSNHGNQIMATTQGNSNFPDLNHLKSLYEQSGGGAVGGLGVQPLHGLTNQPKLSSGRGSQLLPNQMTLPNPALKKTVDNNSSTPGESPEEDGKNQHSSPVRTPTPDQDQPKDATGGSDKEGKLTIMNITNIKTSELLVLYIFQYEICTFLYITGCPICLNEVMTAPVETTCCKQKFCESCLDEALKHSCYCPMCKVALKPVRGNQPPGTMSHTVINQRIPGYEGHGCIVITYHIPSGTQGPEHPNPGKQS